MKLSFTLALLAGAVLAGGDKPIKVSGKEKKYLEFLAAYNKFPKDVGEFEMR